MRIEKLLMYAQNIKVVVILSKAQKNLSLSSHGGVYNLFRFSFLINCLAQPGQ